MQDLIRELNNAGLDPKSRSSQAQITPPARAPGRSRAGTARAGVKARRRPGGHGGGEPSADSGYEKIDTVQRFLISEASYRGARSTPARLWLRLQQYAVYPLYLCGSLLFGKKADVVVVCTNTFYAPWLASFFHKRVVHLVYDLFPEAMAPPIDGAQGLREESCKARESLLHRMIRKIVASTLKRAEVNVFLGERLQAYVESVYGKVENGVVIPVGASAFGAEAACPSCRSSTARGSQMSEDGRRTSEVGGEEVSDLRSPISDLLSPVTILYCGNLGRMHDVKTLETFWGGWSADNPVPAENSEDEIGLGSDSARAGVPALRFLFHCNGPKKQELIDMVAALGLDKSPTSDLRSPLAAGASFGQATSDLRPPISISIQGSLGSEEWREVMLSSQVALVTMVPGAENVVMPSKTYSAMMAGQAILAIAPEASDLVDTIKAADCGWWVKPEVGGQRSEVRSRMIKWSVGTPWPLGRPSGRLAPAKVWQQ
jgi:hypothetical protein